MDLHVVQGTQESSPKPQFKSISSSALSFLYRSFRYCLNQIPYDYTVEVTNRFKGLDLIDRMPGELWTEVRDIVQEAGIKTIPKQKKCKNKMVVSESRTVNRREAKGKGEKERYTHLSAEFQRITRRELYKKIFR